MSPDDPEIPKRFAATLRACYSRVLSARDKIAYVEAKSRSILLELEEYEADPQSYALLRYPTVPDPAAYPTVTHIERLRDWLSDKALKIPEYHEELLIAELAMSSTESEVLAKLLELRASTPGREPWPARPATLQPLRVRWEKEYSNSRKASAKYMQQRQNRARLEADRRLTERAKFLRELAEDIRFKARTMSPGKAAAYLSMMEVLQEKLFGDQLSLADFYDIARGQSFIMKEIIAEAEARAIQRINAITDTT